MDMFYNSPWGTLALRFEGEYLRELSFSNQTVFRESAFFHPEIGRWLDQYFAGQIPPSPKTLLLAPEGTPFQKLIWNILLEIPFGQVVTYGAAAREAARRMGRESMSPQAVGQAVGANPIPLLIPCHRVIASGNKLGGFSCGTALKEKLLFQEKIDLEKPVRMFSFLPSND